MNQAEHQAFIAGFIRGLHNMPLTPDDVGLSLEEMRAKYPCDFMAPDAASKPLITLAHG